MLYLIVPVYNDRRSLLRLVQELADVHASHGPLQLVVVEDGSLLDPLQPAELREQPFSIDLLQLYRNVGHQRAIAIGLAHVAQQADARVVAVLDADGEDRPDQLPRLLDRLAQGGAEVIVARRGRRSEGPLFKAFYRVYQGLFRLLTGRVIRFGNFVALSTRALQRIVHMDELWMHFPATLLLSGLPLGEVEVDRGRRYHGESRMNLVSLVTHGLRSVAVFTESVLTRILLFCAAISVPSLVLIGVASAIKLVGLATPGWFTTAVGVLLVLLAQVATIALVSVLLALQARNGAAQAPLRIAADYLAEVSRLPGGAR
jgi:hypothetical protein